MIGLVRSELIKIRSTNTWWWFAVGALVMTALAFTANAFTAHFTLAADPAEMTQGVPERQSEMILAQHDAIQQAANVYTSGQYFGLLFVMLIGILMVTNEYHHQTVTTTFLTTPKRTAVIVSKLITATLIGAGFWLVTTGIDLVAGAIFWSAEGYGTFIGEWAVSRAILLNLLAYAIWTMFGIGIGTLITNQLGAVITATVLYLLGTQAAQLVFFLLSEWLDSEVVLEWQVIVPSIASVLMISGTELPGSPPQWVGAAVLVGYAVVTGTVGVLITRSRDIS